MLHNALYNKMLRWTSYDKREGLIYKLLERKVPHYTLPSVRKCKDGTFVSNEKEWEEKRRPEILEDFLTQMYGKVPAPPKPLKYTIKTEVIALKGKAIRKEISIELVNNPNENTPKMNVLMYLPAKNPKPCPVFAGLNFYGNQTTQKDPEITLPTAWIRNNEELGITNNCATEKSRGVREYRWPASFLVENGFGLATAYYGDLCLDIMDGVENGIQKYYLKEGQSSVADDEWSAIGAWSWGLSRMVDYFEEDDDVNENRAMVIGHSRLGKTSLWTGARDRRFAIVFVNSSGTGGAALSRRDFGQTVQHINTRRPYWFCGNFHKYNKRVDDLPVDQHMLFALIAPRPAYVGIANRDMWADARGMIKTVQKADEFYKFLGLEGLPHKIDPKLTEPIQGSLGYHVRLGSHNILEYDWKQYLAFAKKHFRMV